MAEVKKENWFKRAWHGTCKYFRELKSELKKVVWPTPKQVLKNTMVVIACVVVIGVFIWLFDPAARFGVNKLIDAVHSLTH
ncbi:MAG: preprotein translocase subunit SecE [Ruminococcaceae bacterium]|nr:preprotein translocase subunit SecE [Oscillospiraceae bacterium]